MLSTLSQILFQAVCLLQRASQVEVVVPILGEKAGTEVLHSQAHTAGINEAVF